MNKTLKMLALAGLMMTAPCAMAQSLGSLAKKAASAAASATGSTAAKAAIDLLGTSTVTAESLVGTWSYSEPAVVLESENVLSNIGGSFATASIEKQLGAQLSKYGFKKGQARLTFKDDRTFALTANGKTVEGTYAVAGATLTLSRSGVASVKTNVKQTGNGLQIAVEADRVLSLVNTLGSAAGSANSNIATVTKLLKQYDGMNLGLKFTK